ncbi:putative sugar phosphate transporter domain-containing protein [Helianthus debilis subsp. tardiflorus]
MVEAQSWTTRRSSNPRLETSVDIPSTPTGEHRYGPTNNFFNPSFISPTIITALIIASWYFSNIGVLLLNKYLLSFYGYKYPIFLTMLHMLACSFYSLLAIRWFQVVPFQQILSRRQFFKILALSVFGIVLASNSEPLFHLFGFLMCVGSTAGRALKSVVQGLLLSSESEKLHSMNLLLYMAPMAAMILLPFSLYIEGNVLSVTLEKAKSDSFMILLLVGNATVAYLVNLTNFLVTKHTSALTLQVLGNAKAAVAAVVSVLIFKNPVTVMGISGFAVTIMGVVLYSEARRRLKVTAH